MTLNEENVTCKHCALLQHEFELLQEKEEKLRSKLKILENQVNDLQLKNNLLEEENKFLKTSQISPKKEDDKAKDDEQKKKIYSILSDFDQLFESQGSQISKLIEDREKLVVLAFKALNLLSKQESVINKFKNATSKLASFISNKGETATSASKEFALLGIDITKELDALQRSFYISKIATPREDDYIISDKEVLDVVNSIVRNDQTTIKKVIDYITHQVAEKEELKNQLENEVSNKNQQLKTFKIISKELHLSKYFHKNENNKSKQKTSSFSNNEALIKKNREKEYLDLMIGEIKKLKSTARSSADFLFIIHEVINILTKFIRKSNIQDENIQSCLKRLKRWLKAPNIKIDLTNEINFLLTSIYNGSNKTLIPQISNNNNQLVTKVIPTQAYGEFYPNKDYYNINENDSASISVDSVLQNIGKERENQNYFETQINDLSQQVERLQNMLTQQDDERKAFIQNRLKGKVSQNASWKKICLLLLEKNKIRA